MNELMLISHLCALLLQLSRVIRKKIPLGLYFFGEISCPYKSGFGFVGVFSEEIPNVFRSTLVPSATY